MKKNLLSPKSFVNFCYKIVLVAMLGGCASGGYKLTRDYSGFVNRQNIVIRIVLYIFTFFVFPITLIADFVLFNTLDFWEGRVSANSYTHEDGDRIFYVENSLQENSTLRYTKIRVAHRGLDESIQDIALLELTETANGKIDFLENGKLKASLDSISSFPQLSDYHALGRKLNEKF